MRFEPAGKPHILMFGHAGVVGYIGLNDRGVGHVGNQLYVSAPGPPARTGGLTQYAINRRLLEFETGEAALAWLLTVPVASTCNYVLGDATGTLVDIELGARPGGRPARGEAVAHTNHYLRPDRIAGDASAAVLPDSPARLEALRTKPVGLEGAAATTPATRSGSAVMKSRPGSRPARRSSSGCPSPRSMSPPARPASPPTPPTGSDRMTTAAPP